MFLSRYQAQLSDVSGLLTVEIIKLSSMESPVLWQLQYVTLQRLEIKKMSL